MAIELTDDGTMDTVLCCSECGEEMRYNYDNGPRDEEDNADRLSEMARKHPNATDAELQSRVDEQCYDEFVESCLEDMANAHECGTDERG